MHAVQVVAHVPLLPAVVEGSPAELAVVGPVVQGAADTDAVAAVAPQHGHRRRLRGHAGPAPTAQMEAAVAVVRLRFVQPLQPPVLIDFTNVTAWCGESWPAAEDVALAALQYAHSEPPVEVTAPSPGWSTWCFATVWLVLL